MTHGHVQGMLSSVQGGNYGTSFLSGAISSGFSSGATALNLGDGGVVLSGGLSGGVGSALNGGNFFEGFGQGSIIALANHLMDKGGKPKKEKTVRQKIEEAKSFATASGHTSTAIGEFEKVTSKLDGLRVYNNPAARRILSLGGQTLGMIGTAGDGVGILTDAYDLGNNKISYGEFAFNTTVTTASFYASTEIHPLAGVAVGLGGTLSTTVYNGFKWWTSKVAEFNTSVESGLRNWRPR